MNTSRSAAWLQNSRVSRTARVGVLTVAAATVFSGCATGSGGGGEGTGVALGADKATYQAALADIAPITLRMNAPLPDGSGHNWYAEYYKEAVEDWSGGKITIELGYSDTFAPEVEKIQALNDGRLNIAQNVVGLEPDTFPLTNALMSSYNQHTGTPAGILTAYAANAELSMGSEKVRQEWESVGVVPMIPLFSTSNLSAVACHDGPVQSTADMQGKSVRVVSPMQADDIESLGGTPVSLPYNEVFEAMQRGTIDCLVTGVEAFGAANSMTVAPYVTLDPKALLTGSGTGVAMGEAWFNSLPLPAQQLLWDRIDAMMIGDIKSDFDRIALGLNGVRDNGGEVVAWDDSTRNGLIERHDQRLANLEDFDVSAAYEKWGAVVKELGFPDDPDTFNWLQWADAGNYDFDVDAFVADIYDQVFAQYRPGN